MRLGIMQPYFFPYPGHFGLIASVDEWIVFDVTQYTPKTWINRNRVLHPRGGPAWMTVPLGNASISILIREAAILDPPAARASVLGKLSHYRPHVRRARYDRTCGLVEAAFGDGTDPSLVGLDVRGLEATCRLLGIPFRHRVCSSLGLALPDRPGPGGWAPAICARLGATSYVNPAGGAALFDPRDFAAAGTALLLARTAMGAYPTGPCAGPPGLSVLDALMWMDPPELADRIRAGTVLERVGDDPRPAAAVLPAPPGPGRVRAPGAAVAPPP